MLIHILVMSNQKDLNHSRLLVSSFMEVNYLKEILLNSNSTQQSSGFREVQDNHLNLAILQNWDHIYHLIILKLEKSNGIKINILGVHSIIYCSLISLLVLGMDLLHRNLVILPIKMKQLSNFIQVFISSTQMKVAALNSLNYNLLLFLYLEKAMLENLFLQQLSI